MVLNNIKQFKKIYLVLLPTF